MTFLPRIKDRKFALLFGHHRILKKTHKNTITSAPKHINDFDFIFHASQHDKAEIVLNILENTPISIRHF